MTIRHYMRELYHRFLIAAIIKTNPISKLAVQDYAPDDAQQPQFNQTANLKVYLVNVYAFAAQRAIARDVSTTPLLAQKRKRTKDGLVWETVQDGDLFDLINEPNSDRESWQEISERWCLGLLGAGDGYLIYDGTDKEVFPTQSDWVKVQVDAAGRLIGYKIVNNAMSFNAEVDELVHAKLANPTGQFYGVPPSQVVKQSIMAKLSMDRYLNMFFEKGAMLGTILSTEQTLDDPQIKRMSTAFNNLHAGVGKAFTTAIMDGGVTASQLAPVLKNLIPIEIDAKIRGEVLAAYGVPPIKIGSLDGASYANAFQQDSNYQHGTVEPIRRQLESAFNTQLVRVLFGPDERVHWDRKAVPGLLEDQREASLRSKRLYTGGIVTKNEARGMVGFDPVGPEDGGDEFLEVLPGVGAEPAALSYKPPNSVRTVKDSSAARWVEHNDNVTALEIKFERVLRNYFDWQEARMLDGFDGMAENEPIATPTLDLDLFLDIEADNTMLVEDTVPFTSRVIAESGAEAFNEGQAIKGWHKAPEIKPRFDLKNPEVFTMIREFENRMTDINDTTYRAITEIISEGYEAGSTVNDIASSIAAEFTQIKKVRAKRIALTEINGMVNGGNQQGHKQAGVTHKRWMAAFLPTSRAWHVEADGQERGIDERFQIGGSNMLYPGDTTGRVEDVVNCHCTYAPIIKET